MENDIYVALDLLDRVTGCPIHREKLSYNSIHQTFEDIELGDLRNGQIISLDEKELCLLAKAVDLRVDDDISGAELMIWHPHIRPLESSHTRRELWLMLRGEKPLAAFSEEFKGDISDTVIPEKYFFPYVQAGRFVRRELIEDFPAAGTKIRRVLYATPAQEWRIDAYLALWELSSKIGWRDGFEQFEGYLLGYNLEESAHRDATTG